MKSKAHSQNLIDLRERSDEVAALLRQLSHPQRLLILCSLVKGEKSVGEIEESCGASQSSVSQFLKGMRLEGLVEARREGKQVFYSINDPRVFELMNTLFKIFCQ